MATAQKVLSLVVSPAASGRTLYVRSNGNDANNGLADTAAGAWKTLQKAANTVIPGDTVIVRSANYQGMNIYGKAGGNASAPIKFLADSGVNVTSLPTSGNPNDNAAGINVESSGAYWTIQGFNVTAAGTQKASIRIAVTDHVSVLNNTVSGGFTGIFLSTSVGSVIQGNTCSNSTDQHGIYVSLNTSGTVVRGNTLHDNHWDGIHMNCLVGSPNDGALVEDNTCYNNGLAGMDLEGISNATVQNNRIYGNSSHGITVHSQDQANTPVTTNLVIVNNTIWVSNTNIRACIQAHNEDTGGMVIFNNILLQTGNGGSIFLFANSPVPTSDFNTVSDKFSFNGGSTITTLASWRTTAHQDAHSNLSTPTAEFVNQSTPDLHLLSGAVSVNHGTLSLVGKSAPTTDFDGNTRPRGAGYDCGCYESSF